MRGLSDLETVSAAIKDRNYLPELILCSPAERTRQTLDGISGAFNPVPDVQFVDKLYSGGMEDYVSVLRSTADVKSVMTIGHNPMSGSLATHFSGSGSPELIADIAYKYPTATIAVLDFDADSWSDISVGAGKLVDCIIPSKLRT